MFETYKKPSKHPSAAVGEQDGKESWNATQKTGYKGLNVHSTAYNGDRVNTRSCEGSSGSPNGNDYPKSRVKFGTEKHVGK